MSDRSEPVDAERVYRIGEIEVRVVSGGRFRLDGGGMFGVVPRALWSRRFSPDDAGRIELDTNCLLVRTGDETILIDSGNGSKLSEKERRIFDVREDDDIRHSLLRAGVRPEEITLVLLSHLHMDHSGGASRLESGEVLPAFPNARVMVQRREWEDALHNRSHMTATYRMENLLPLQAGGRLHLLDGDVEVAPGVSVHVTGGHTPGHQCVFLRSRDETGVYLADVCPTTAHMRGPWNMAYDLEPLVTMRAKTELLNRAAQEGWILFFDHDPNTPAARARREGDQVGWQAAEAAEGQERR